MMKTILYPAKQDWELICRRPIIEQQGLTQVVFQILERVKDKGDAALKDYTRQFDGLELQSFLVSKKEFQESELMISQELKQAIAIAKKNIEKFHRAQISPEAVVETTSGVTCWRRSVGIEKVGLYIPGGSAPLFSTVLMLGIPATIANCKEIILCTPCNSDARVHPAILYTANLLGINKVYKLGGAQAVAAMAYGTPTIPAVYKIFGPGNQFVTKAKELVQQQGVAIDMPAGPSEVLIIADDSSNAEFVAADLLSQAEHGPDSQVLLLCTDAQMIEKVNDAVAYQLQKLPRRDIAKHALKNSFAVQLNTLEECFAFSNVYAPEHLIIAVEGAEAFTDQIINAGSVFLGKYSCESAGDYASGTNHTLPTNGYAKSYSGVSVSHFLKKISFQKITEEGIRNIGPAVEIMALAEGLTAHKNAVSIRLKNIVQ